MDTKESLETQIGILRARHEEIAKRLEAQTVIHQQAVDKIMHGVMTTHDRLYGENGTFIQVKLMSEEVKGLARLPEMVSQLTMACGENARQIRELTEKRSKNVTWWQQLLLTVLAGLILAVTLRFFMHPMSSAAQQEPQYQVPGKR